MLKKTETYTDFNGVTRTEDFYFYLSEAELMEMELGIAGGFTEFIEKIVAANDTVELTKLFKKIILKAYGIKSPDGKRFIKSDEISEEFSQTPVYSHLFMELATDSEAASEFITGVVPTDLAGKVNQNISKPHIV